MLTAIVKRECLDHLLSLRFSFALVLVVVLMVLNALGFAGGTYSYKRDRYLEKVQAQQETLRANADRLWQLAVRGPGDLHKKPSQLMFCAAEADHALPNRVGAYNMTEGTYKIKIYGIWVLSFLGSHSFQDSLRRTAQQLLSVQAIDWVFIIGVVLSLVALLFTFEAIVGEKERGTLKLVMAQSLPRHTLLLGKFLGAMLVLTLVMVLGVVVNLLLVLSLSEANLGAGETAKLVGMVGLALLYLSIFVSLGLWVSARSSSARASLVSVLLLWTCTTLIWPQTGGVLAARLLQNKSQSATPVIYKKDKMVMESPTISKMSLLAAKLTRRNLKNPEKVQPFAEAIRTDRRAVQQVEDSILADQLNQAEFARNLVRLSPMGCFQYSMEALAGTGLARHKSFIEQVRTYAQLYEQTIIALDRADPKSMHLFPVPQAMSKRKVSVESLPVFREDLSAGTLIGQARVDVISLCFLPVITYLIAYGAWLRSSVI